MCNPSWVEGKGEWGGGGEEGKKGEGRGKRKFSFLSWEARGCVEKKNSANHIHVVFGTVFHSFWYKFLILPPSLNSALKKS